MPALHVRDVDDAILDALKARAARNHRSLQGEVRAILEAAAAEAGRAKKGRRLRIKTVRVGAPVKYSREVIYEDGTR
jgi:plasmid stability protein